MLLIICAHSSDETTSNRGKTRGPIAPRRSERAFLLLHCLWVIMAAVDDQASCGRSLQLLRAPPPPAPALGKAAGPQRARRAGAAPAAAPAAARLLVAAGLDTGRNSATNLDITGTSRFGIFNDHVTRFSFPFNLVWWWISYPAGGQANTTDNSQSTNYSKQRFRSEACPLQGGLLPPT